MGTNRKKKVRFFRHLIILTAIIITVIIGLKLYISWFDSANKICGRFTSSVGDTPRICFEIADTEGKRAKGLMFRKSGELPEDQGMLFIYPDEGLRSFWMKNTFIPLDMIFMDSQKTVVGIVESASPLTESPRKVDRPSQLILELNAGSAKKWGIAVGSVFKTEEQLPTARE